MSPICVGLFLLLLQSSLCWRREHSLTGARIAALLRGTVHVTCVRGTVHVTCVRTCSRMSVRVRTCACTRTASAHAHVLAHTRQRAHHACEHVHGKAAQQ